MPNFVELAHKLDVPLPAPHQLALRLTTHGSARSTTIVNINLPAEPQQQAHNHMVLPAKLESRMLRSVTFTQMPLQAFYRFQGQLRRTK
jgi:hypothetical protein